MLILKLSSINGVLKEFIKLNFMRIPAELNVEIRLKLQIKFESFGMYENLPAKPTDYCDCEL